MPTLTDVAQALLDISADRTYLEITRYYDGESSSLASNRAVVVAHETSPSSALGGNGNEAQRQVIVGSSDDYFSRKTVSDKFDVILLDGLHTFEQTYRDLQNAVLCVSDNGVIIIDDIVPNSYLASLPDVDMAYRIRAEANSHDLSWMGDVYKLKFLIDGYFQQFSFATVKETGRQLILWRKSRPPSALRSLKLEAICRLSYADVLDQATSFNFAPLARITAAVQASKLVLSSDQDASEGGQIPSCPADYLRAKDAGWADGIIDREGRSHLADETTISLPELRCTNANVLSAYALQSYNALNSARSLNCRGIYAYALEDVTLLPHGALLVGDMAVEEPLSRISEEFFMKDVRKYYNYIKAIGRGDQGTEPTHGPVIVIEQPGMFNYGHVLIEMVPKLMPFLDYIRNGTIKVALQSKYESYNFIISILSFLGIKKDAIFWFNISGEPHDSITRVQRLIYVSPITKHVFPSYKSPWGVNALNEMASVIAPGRQRKIFISRKDAAGRMLVNEDDVFELFSSMGYERICTGAMSFEEQVAAFKGATHVVGVYGASLTNIVFCEPGTKAWLLCPSNSVDSFYWELAGARDVAYQQTVGCPVPGQETDRNCDFEIEEQDILRVIDDFDRE